MELATSTSSQQQQEQTRTTSQLNREAIRLFQTEQYAAAKETLVMALSAIKRQCSTEVSTTKMLQQQQQTLTDGGQISTISLLVDDDDDNNDKEQPVSTPTSTSSTYKATTTIKITRNKKTMQGRRVVADYFPHYDKAFHYDNDIQEEAPISAILLFNLGLFCHDVALQRNDKTILYKKAIKVYNKAYQIAMTTVNTCCTSYTTISAMMIIASACLHNLSHCYFVGLLNKNLALSYQDQQTNLLQWIHDNLLLSSQCQQRNFIFESEYNLFVCSCFMAKSQIKSCNVAPAA